MITYSKFSDTELTESLRLGDAMAFTEIYERFFGVLYQHALHRLKDEAAAKDVVQGLFETLWFKRNEILLKTSLTNYLYTAVRNRALKVIAHQNVTAAYAEKQISFVRPDEGLTDHRIRERQLAAIIEKEVQSLPPKMKEVFELSRKNNYTHKEIAAQLGITEQSVRSHVKNALKILRVKLGFVLYFFMLFGGF
ncbi:RNA polymerase sigma factor [Pedobacter nutrimenti]|jgi:RNA polymerase sigma-70 factor (ECF subfamily)|uniref:RNA polymerase sigma-70 factor (ECF subfamily) n=1 Tax=Pedobacter nutrimenti TaxID=1241337 RepID=A0A318UGQ5_9SPHI|nr:RNA polymerase sigma-70 factor [Pedobacter nutrimenti]PYF74178.1 RNA polymerase sigma-70 factor (ECF subfamily) [Pedobacter nutrimenti]|eukprot:gene16611-19730_t